MPTLIRKWNYRNISLTDPPSSTETVGVFLKSGEVRQMKWRGFLFVEEAKARGATPVRLDIAAIIETDKIGSPRIDLKLGEYPQGALIDGVVFGVLNADGAPKIVTPLTT